MIGPSSDKYQISFLICAQIASALFYFFLTAPYIWTNISPSIVVGISIILVFHTFFFVLTVITEPGIIPRKEVFQLYGEVPK